MHEPSEERALRDAALRGDEEAWRVLFERHVDAAYRYAYVRVGRHAQRAEEAVQEAWMIAVRKLNTFDPTRGTFGAWLQGILSNVLANHRRKWARRDATELSLPDTSALAPKTVANNSTADPELMAHAFTELPDHYQEAIRAKYVDGMTTQEIATQSNKTPKAIESLLGRARAAFRQVYTQLENETSENPTHE